MKSRIKQLIVAKGLRQKEVAKAIKVTDQQLSNWVNGLSYPQFEKAYRLAKFLGVRMEDLYDNDDT